jgi:hypothetical protein
MSYSGPGPILWLLLAALVPGDSASRESLSSCRSANIVERSRDGEFPPQAAALHEDPEPIFCRSDDLQRCSGVFLPAAGYVDARTPIVRLSLRCLAAAGIPRSLKHVRLLL